MTASRCSKAGVLRRSTAASIQHPAPWLTLSRHNHEEKDMRPLQARLLARRDHINRPNRHHHWPRHRARRSLEQGAERQCLE
jgi:hypothetical protein